jgi:hypothetical protein
MKRILSAAVLAAMLAGCGGGGGHTVPSAGGGTPGNGSGSGGNQTPVNAGRGTATVIANANIAAASIPQLYDSKSSVSRKQSSIRKLKASSVTSVEVDGTLYQGSATAVPVTNTQTVPLSASGTIVVSETFSNVVAANNDWIAFEFYAISNDGSKVALGTLGTFVNVGSTTTTASLSTTSTQVLEVAGSLLSIGAISTYDIENNANLASALATDIAAQNLPVNSQTGLYDPTTLLTLTENLATAFERDITVTAANAAMFSVVYDSTQKDENDLAYNALSFATRFGLDVVFSENAGYNSGGIGAYSSTTVIGAPETTGCTEDSCGLQTGTIPFSGPSSGYGDAQPTVVTAGLFNAASGTVTFRNVYGGHIIIGAHNNVGQYSGNYETSVARKAASTRRTGAAATVHTASTQSTRATRTPQSGPAPGYAGATLAISGEGPGATSQTLPLSSTAATVSVVDAQAADFDSNSPGRYENFGYFGFAPVPGANAVGNVPLYQTECTAYDTACVTYGLIQEGLGEIEVYLGQAASPTTDVIPMTFDDWNPFAIPLQQIDICSPSNCAIAGTGPTTPTTSTLNIGGAFDDPGNAVGVYNWQPGASGATQSIAQDPNTCCGGDYLVTYNVPANNTSGVSGSLTGTVSSTATVAAPFPITAYVPARAQLYFNSSLPSDAIVTVTFTGTNGETYTENLDPSGWTPSTSIAAPFDIASWVINYTLPADDVQNSGNPATTGTFNIYQFSVGEPYTINDDCC